MLYEATLMKSLFNVHWQSFSFSSSEAGEPFESKLNEPLFETKKMARPKFFAKSKILAFENVLWHVVLLI
jgi:hypothetical protein